MRSFRRCPLCCSVKTMPSVSPSKFQTQAPVLGKWDHRFTEEKSSEAANPRITLSVSPTTPKPSSSSSFDLNMLNNLGFLSIRNSAASTSSSSLSKDDEEPQHYNSPNPTMMVRTSNPVITTKSGLVITKLRFFVGFDPREELAYEVCRHSILKRATMAVEIVPIKMQNLRESGLYTRAQDATESTEFSFTRFLTPFLSGFEGWSVFVDCDFLYTADIRELAELIDPDHAVMCVHHDYSPTATRKMDGALQTCYPRKNWSSMVLYNCAHPKNKILTPDLVSSQSGAFLHRFMWLDDGDIGDIPVTWNFLVGHNVADPGAAGPPKAIHFTSGGPWFDSWRDCEFATLWIQERDDYWRAQCSPRMVTTPRVQDHITSSKSRNLNKSLQQQQQQQKKKKQFRNQQTCTFSNHD